MNNWTLTSRGCSLTLKDKEVLISKEDLAIVGKYHWFLSGQTKWPEVRAKKQGRVIVLSRLILSAVSGQIVDHINGNRLDNRRENLRLATHTENGRNRRISINNTSGFKGVTYCKALNKWIAQIEIKVDSNRKGISIGYFANKVEAAKAYDAKALELFGEFAKLNFPEGF